MQDGTKLNFTYVVQLSIFYKTAIECLKKLLFVSKQGSQSMKFANF